jgi:hypothetical protein
VAGKNRWKQQSCKVTKTQKEAIDTGRTIAKNQHSELVFHGENGGISDKDSYGEDHNPPKDTKH